MKVKGNMKKFYQYAFPMQAAILTCNDPEGNVNPITVAWHTTLSKKPPLYGVSIAPQRYSHELIENSKEFVINFASYDLLEKIHFCGTHTGRKTDKIKVAGLTLVDAEIVKTKIIKECFAHLECRLYESKVFGDHTFFVGEVVNAIIDEDAFIDDALDNSKTQPCYYIGGNSYSKIDKIKHKF